MVTLGTSYIIRPETNEVDVQPGVMSCDRDKLPTLISSCYATNQAVVYIEVQVWESFWVLTASPTIYYKPSGSDETQQVEILPDDIKAMISNIR